MSRPVYQAISGAYFIAVAQSLFANRMLHKLRIIAPHIDALMVLNTGASEIQHVFKGEDLATVLDAYMVGLNAIFASALACSALAVLVSLIIPFKKLPDYDGKHTGKRATA